MPRDVAVNYTAQVVSCNNPFADADGDTDVDSADFAVFPVCITAPEDPWGIYDTLPSTCRCMGITGAGGASDEAIDQRDLDLFLLCLATSGPSIPANRACDD